MSSYVGPNGRRYLHTSHRVLWITLTVHCTAFIGLIIVGAPNVAIGIRYLGL